MIDEPEVVDVAVLGGGNAALCAALEARNAGAGVILLEGAPREFRGGNTRHTRNLRIMHERSTNLLSEVYSEAEYFDDLLRVTGGKTNEALARITIRHSATCPDWMRKCGVRLQSPLKGTLHLGRTNAFLLGGGKALVNSYYSAAHHLGIRVAYDAEIVGLELRDRMLHSVSVLTGDRLWKVQAKAVVLGAGGFESNLEWLKTIWGDAADNFIIRGTPYNRGKVLALMLEHGARSVGEANQCHAVAIDSRAPKFDGGIVTRLDGVTLGIVVNRHGQRFYDEGEDLWPKRYAIWGRLVAQQPDQAAYLIIDAKAHGKFIPSVFPPESAHSIRELAARIGLCPDSLECTVTAFNRGVQPGVFNHAILDDCRTVGLHPDKTHWARTIDLPPFMAYPLKPGITFTYLGLAVDENARVTMADGSDAKNIYAAGEIMAGNILGQGYLAGIGMTIGTVFGRIAGREAAKHVDD